MSNDIIANGYQDWIRCLEYLDKKDEILSNPFNVWVEAFETGTMIERLGVVHLIHQMMREAKNIDEQNMLQGVIDRVQSKGMSREKNPTDKS